jgi:phage/conjugal plasmid C-4 type zinc finger TraR family protein
MDEFDRASEQEEKDREAAIEAARGHYKRNWEVSSAQECVGCFSHIPEERREAIPGVQLCVACQTEAERIARRYRR